MPRGVWPEPPHTAVVLPIAKQGQDRLAGFLVAGISPRRALDEHYRGFLDLVANQIATAIANARAYEEERKRAEALAELDRAKTAFFSNVSHEFRTPLTLMLGPVEELLAKSHTDLSPAAASQLEVVNRNGLRLLRLVNTLLDFSRIEAGRVRASYQPTDLAAFTAELASVFRAAVERAGLRLLVDCPQAAASRSSSTATCGRRSSSTCSPTPSSSPSKARSRSRCGRRKPRSVELRVRDTGTGIPAAEMPRLFERFHRVENGAGPHARRQRHRAGAGAGAGQAARRHGHGGERGRRGHDVHRHPAARDRRIFRPTRSAQDARWSRPRPAPPPSSRKRCAGCRTRTETRRRAPPSSRSGTRPCQCPRPERRRTSTTTALASWWPTTTPTCGSYLVRLLAEHYRVEAVPDGEAALAAVRRELPDLVLTDVMMPRLDGFGLLRELRADPATRDLPVILLSARAGEESRVEGLEAGADDYLIKPFSARELLARVQSSLTLARVRREAERVLRQQGAQFKTLLDQAPMGVYLVDADFRIREVNPVAQPVFGDIPGGVVGRDFDDVMHLLWEKSYADEVVRIFRHTLETGEPFVTPERGELRIDRGVTEYYEWRLDRIPLPDGRHGVVCYFRDISAQVNARKSIEESREALREADRRKDEFLATLAHELRNPLAPLRNTLEIMKRADAGAELLEQARDTMERQLSSWCGWSTTCST